MPLEGDRRINDQWRVCFVWHDGDVHDVEIVHGMLAITANTALRVARFFGTSEQFWLNLQNRFALVEYTEAGDLVGDAYLFARLRQLGDGGLPRPLVHLTDEGAGLRGARLRLTDTGREVRTGRLSAVDLNGIDDRVGGGT